MREDQPQRTTPAHNAPAREVQAYTNPGDLPAGTIIGGVWEVDSQLGKGGMGSVYRCHNRHAPRIVAAIKLLDPAFQHHKEAKARFLREAEILSTVDHPNVVNVSNVNLDNAPPFIEMEFVDGLALEDELSREGALPVEVAVERATELGSALRYIHRKRIYHRDIKPQNILIRRDGALMLVDFGLAVEVERARITRTEITNFGTVSYCPPEWGGMEVVDPASWDLYALGVVFYEMLTGSVAFPMSPMVEPRRQLVQVITQKQRIEYLDVGPRFEPHLREIIKSLTMRDRNKRCPDAKTFLNALKQIDLSWTPPPPSRVPTEEPTPMPVAPVQEVRSSNRALGLIALVALLGLLVGFLAAGAVFVLLLSA